MKVVYTIKFKRKMIKGVLRCQKMRKEGWKESIKDRKEGGGRGGERSHIHIKQKGRQSQKTKH